MTLYFAYGANMERAAMAKRCPGAQPLGPRAPARLALCDRAAATARSRRRRGGGVFGVLWRLTPRDLAALNVFESLDSGLYRRAMLTVEIGGPARAGAGLCRASNAAGAAPMPGYQERLVAAAEDWKLPPRYVAELRRLAPGYRGARPAETGEIG